MAEIARAENPLDLSLSEAECEEYRKHIAAFITEQLADANADQAIVALSGGIDSTLTGHLTVDALGTDRVYGLVLPSEVNPETSMSDAERVAADLLGIEYDVVGIQNAVDAVVAASPEIESATDRTTDPIRGAVGNLRARLRADLTYLAANLRNGLVIGTGNRSEALVGYFTKYGDGAVDCHPIAPLYKAQVRQLASSLGVPQKLVEKPPSAELWTGQSDEAELGLDYPTLDSILALSVDGPLSPSATARELGVERRLVERVHAMHERSAHKRQVPPGPQPLF